MVSRHIIMAGLLVLSLFATMGCGPDLDDVDLSGCMTGCNTVAKTCLDTANENMLACTDDVCRHAAVVESETCLTSCLDCLTVCVKETEKQLKK